MSDTTREQLVKKAQEKGLAVRDDASLEQVKADLKAAESNRRLIRDAGTSENKEAKTAPNSRKEDKVTVSENENGEATHGTTKHKSKGAISNTDSIPQNGVTKIETTEPTNEVARRADAARTKAEIKFADEANPNQRARTKGAANAQEDVDGHQRTGGISLGVSSDDPGATVPQREGAGTAPRSSSPAVESYKLDESVTQRDFLHGDTNAGEWTVEDQQKLEDSLSEPANGIIARVTISAGDYVKVKFFRNNLVFGTYKSKKFTEAGAKEFLTDLKKNSGL